MAFNNTRMESSFRDVAAWELEFAEIGRSDFRGARIQHAEHLEQLRTTQQADRSPMESQR